MRTRKTPQGRRTQRSSSIRRALYGLALPTSSIGPAIRHEAITLKIVDSFKLSGTLYGKGVWKVREKS